MGQCRGRAVSDGGVECSLSAARSAVREPDGRRQRMPYRYFTQVEELHHELQAQR